jgi:uracil-DNA glycosylase family 4
MAKKKAPHQLPADFDLQTYLSTKRLIPGRGNPASNLWIIGEAGGSHEHDKRQPFVGPSGQELSKMSNNAGFTFGEVYLDNVIPFQPPRNKLDLLDVPVETFYPLLQEKLARFRPNCVVTAGGTALRALCGVGGITLRRGSILSSTLVPGVKVVPMVHPAELFKDWSWRTYMIFDLARAFEESKTPDKNLPVRNLIIRPSFQQALEVLDELSHSPRICIDIETRRGRIACIGVGNSKDWSLCVPLERRDGSSYWSESQEAELFRAFSAIFENPEIIKIGQNFSFDFAFLHGYRLLVQGDIWDTMWMHNLLWPDFEHGLHVLGSFYTREPYYKEEGKLWERSWDEDMFWQYNCKDVCVTTEVFDALWKELETRGLMEFYKLHYLKQMPKLLGMQMRGFRIHEHRRDRMRKTWEKKVARAQAALEAKYNVPLNVMSYPDMVWLLYEHLHLPVQRDRRTGNPTTKEDALEKLFVKTQNQTLLQVLELRGLRKFLGSYLNVTVDDDSRIRCAFGHTDFGRLKASKFLDTSGTNLQTIPEVGRAFFIAD